MSKFVTVETSTGTVFLNVDNIVAVHPSTSRQFKIITNATWDSRYKSYTIKGDVEDFFKKIGEVPILFK